MKLRDAFCIIIYVCITQLKQKFFLLRLLGRLLSICIYRTKLFPCVVEGDGVGDSCKKVSFGCETLLFTNSNNVDEILAVDKEFIGVCMHKISGMD